MPKFVTHLHTVLCATAYKEVYVFDQQKIILNQSVTKLLFFLMNRIFYHHAY